MISTMYSRPMIEESIWNLNSMSSWYHSLHALCFLGFVPASSAGMGLHTSIHGQWSKWLPIIAHPPSWKHIHFEWIAIYFLFFSLKGIYIARIHDQALWWTKNQDGFISDFSYHVHFHQKFGECCWEQISYLSPYGSYSVTLSTGTNSLHRWTCTLVPFLSNKPLVGTYTYQSSCFLQWQCFQLLLVNKHFSS